MGGILLLLGVVAGGIKFGRFDSGYGCDEMGIEVGLDCGCGAILHEEAPHKARALRGKQLLSSDLLGFAGTSASQD
jgi:hypothetical protein